MPVGVDPTLPGVPLGQLHCSTLHFSSDMPHELFHNLVVGSLFIILDMSINGDITESAFSFMNKHTAPYARTCFLEPSVVQKWAEKDPRLLFYEKYTTLLEAENLYIVAAILCSSGTLSHPNDLRAMLPHADSRKKGPMINSRSNGSLSIHYGERQTKMHELVSRESLTDGMMGSDDWSGGATGELKHCGNRDRNEMSFVHQLGGKGLCESTSRNLHFPAVKKLMQWQQVAEEARWVPDKKWLDDKKQEWFGRTGRISELREFMKAGVGSRNHGLKKFYYGVEHDEVDTEALRALESDADEEDEDDEDYQTNEDDDEDEDE